MTIVLLWLLFWVPFAIIVGVGASKRGRSGFGFFLFSIAFSPILGAILLWAVGTRAPRKERVKAYYEQRKRIDWKTVDWSPDATQNVYQVREELNRKADNRQWMIAGAVCVGLILLLVLMGNKSEQTYHQTAGQPLDLARTLTEKPPQHPDYKNLDTGQSLTAEGANTHLHSTTATWDREKGWIEPEPRRSDRETVIVHPDKNDLRKSTTAYWDNDKGWVTTKPAVQTSTPEFDARMQKMCDPYKYVCKKP